MDKPDIATLLRNTPKLASLPTVYNKLNEAVDSPTSSSQDIADIIMEDSALAARLLKLSNSAFFGFPSRIDTISQAVTVIGMRELRDLVLATSVVSMFKDIPTNLVSPESFIEHSIATGVAARVMATHRRESNVERFFVAGLLHDIGRLVLFMNFPEPSAQILAHVARTGESQVELEKKILGYSHPEVTRELLTSWKLPPRLVQTAAYYFKPSLCKDYRQDATLVHLGDIMAKALRFGSDGDPYAPLLDDRSLEQLEFDSNQLANIVKDVEVQIRAFLEFMAAV